MDEKKKKEIKKFIINSIKVISFILVFVILIDVLSLTVFSKSKATTYKNKFKNAYNFVNEVDNSIDIVGLGNSDLYSAVVPVKLWDKNGYTSTIVASPHQTTSMCYAMLKEILKKQSPKFVILEADMFYEGVELNTELIDGESKNKGYFNFIPYISGKYLTEAIENRFPIFLLHDRWKKITAGFFGKTEKEKSDVKNSNFDHGYVFHKNIKRVYPNGNMNYTDAVEELPQETVLYLSKITTLCKDNDIQLMFINAPSFVSWSYARHNAVREYADNNNIPYLDFNTLEDYKINYKRDFRDNGNHMNYYGAKKITNYIGNYIKENYSDIIDDKRKNPDYSYWYTDKETFISIYRIKKF